MDSLFFGSCLNVCTHFEILRESFVGDKKKFINRHQMLSEFTENFTKLFKVVIFSQLFCSSMQLCVLGFQLVAIRSFYHRAVVAVFGLAIIIQLFIYCYGCQLILDKTTEVADHLYVLDKDFVIIIARAHKGKKVKAWFYDPSLSTMSAILSSAASLITLLRSFLK